MISFIKKTLTWAFAIITGIFTFIPESIFGSIKWITPSLLEKIKSDSTLEAYAINVVISRFICFGGIWIILMVAYASFRKLHNATTLHGENYSIRVEYADILQKKDCKRIINFDECFTSQVGDGIADINPQSICGQYLAAHPDLDIEGLIKAANVVPARGRSKYQQKMRYEPGTIVPNGDDLLMAFARLDERGKGRFFSRDEYINCLERLWKELEYHYSEKDVCIPILGAGTTSFDGGTGASFSQQDLLDIMIHSYRLSSHKIKAPHKLIIVCKRNKNFSIMNVNK